MVYTICGLFPSLSGDSDSVSPGLESHDTGAAGLLGEAHLLVEACAEACAARRHLEAQDSFKLQPCLQRPHFLGDCRASSTEVVILGCRADVTFCLLSKEGEEGEASRLDQSHLLS